MSVFREYLVDEYVDEYEQGRLSRRDALRYLAAIVGSATLAGAVLAACTPPSRPASPPGGATSIGAQPAPAPSPTTALPDASAVEAGPAQFPGQGVTLLGYLARPQGSGPFPALLVCHENTGLVEHIKDVTRRLAGAGYVSLAVDLLSREGGTEGIRDAARVPGTLSNTPNDQFAQDFQDALRYLQGQPYVRGDRVGMVGFCFGGGVTWLVASRIPSLRAVVPFYGPLPMPADELRNVSAPVLAIYGERDRLTAGIPTIEAAMGQYGKTFDKVVYANAGHAFLNDTRSGSYNAEAARDAWARMLAWFDRYLKDGA